MGSLAQAVVLSCLERLENTSCQTGEAGFLCSSLNSLVSISITSKRNSLGRSGVRNSTGHRIRVPTGVRLGVKYDSGGSARESNPPTPLVTRHNGFEVRKSHRAPSTPVDTISGVFGGRRARRSLVDTAPLSGGPVGRLFRRRTAVFTRLLDQSPKPGLRPACPSRCAAG